jgi:hypothetical protein
MHFPTPFPEFLHQNADFELFNMAVFYDKENEKKNLGFQAFLPAYLKAFLARVATYK